MWTFRESCGFLLEGSEFSEVRLPDVAPEGQAEAATLPLHGDQACTLQLFEMM